MRDQDRLRSVVDAMEQQYRKEATDQSVGAGAVAGSLGGAYSPNGEASNVLTPTGRAAIDLHGLGWAIKQMHDGARVARRGWNGPGQFLAMQVPDPFSKMTRPYIYITTVQGDRVPWFASQADLLARDWFVL